MMDPLFAQQGGFPFQLIIPAVLMVFWILNKAFGRQEPRQQPRPPARRPAFQEPNPNRPSRAPTNFPRRPQQPDSGLGESSSSQSRPTTNYSERSRTPDRRGSLARAEGPDRDPTLIIEDTLGPEIRPTKRFEADERIEARHLDSLDHRAAPLVSSARPGTQRDDSLGSGESTTPSQIPASISSLIDKISAGDVETARDVFVMTEILGQPRSRQRRFRNSRP